jgi:cytochrome oxidase Cu insertion factor (SCO1/SenC/PrrC family)
MRRKGNVTAERFTVIAGAMLMAGALWSAPAILRAQGVAGARKPRAGQSAVTPLKEGPLTAADTATIARKWGIHIETMRLAAGGYMLELRYRILDANKAQPLFDRGTKPRLYDDGSAFESAVPNMPTTGALRSTNDAKAGRTYFMFFANPGRFIKPGGAVTVSIGDFRVGGIPVVDDSGPVTQEKTLAGHEGHLAQIAAAPKTPAARVMSPQPAFGGITLVDQRGQATTLGEAIGSDKPVLLNFIFTTCTTICPVMSAGMSQFLTNLGTGSDRVRVISISIDPELDTVAALGAYAERYHAPASWRLLTGTAAAVEAAQRAFGNYRGGKNSHAPGTFVRSSADAPWLALDGFSSADTLLHASLGHIAPAQP